MLNSDHREGQIGRPKSLDAYGSRVFQYPAEVKGYFRTRRNVVYAILIIIFLALPWIKIGGHQAILLDIPGRQFSFFGIHFWAHDAPLIFFIFAFLTLGLAFVTAIWGRVWCGWACPQTVFIDGIYRRIETWIEGSHLARRKLDLQDWNREKILKRSSKWLAFFVVSFLISHSFLAYFVGSQAIIEYVQHPPSENWTTFLIVMSFTAFLLFDFGWFREQFCIIMCPYGRFQSVLMDESSLAIVYDENRVSHVVVRV
ncbi:MAG: 4Fe-4S binding protein [Bdellovibrionales bacterium]